MKKCSQCGTEKALEEFYVIKRTGGHSGACKVCVRGNSAKWRAKNPERFTAGVRNAQLRARYGIEPHEYERVLAAQGGGCALCARSAEQIGRKNLSVDQCPKTGAVRGLLCAACSSGIGALGDDADRIIRAAEYLESFQ